MLWIAHPSRHVAENHGQILGSEWSLIEENRDLGLCFARWLILPASSRLQRSLILDKKAALEDIFYAAPGLLTYRNWISEEMFFGKFVFVWEGVMVNSKAGEGTTEKYPKPQDTWDLVPSYHFAGPHIWKEVPWLNVTFICLPFSRQLCIWRERGLYCLWRSVLQVLGMFELSCGHLN